MSKALQTLLLLAAAFAGAHSTGDNLNSNNQWPSMPFWFSNSGNTPPAGPNQNNATNPFAFGAYPPPQAPNGQPWLHPFAYQQFGQQPPCGFAPALPPMFYSGLQGQLQPIPGTAAALPSSENNNMSVDTPTHLATTGSQSGQGHHTNAMPRSSREGGIASSSCSNDMTVMEQRTTDDHHVPTNLTRSRWRSPSREQEHRDDRNSSNPHDRKGKSRVSHQELECMHELEEDERRWEMDRDEDAWQECARLRAECTPIPQHVVDMQRRDFEECRPDPMANALRDQISMNVELMHRCEELKKMLNKRQLSPDGQLNQSSKRHRDSRPSQLEHRHRMEEYDDYLTEDEDYPTPRHQWRDLQWRERGRGGSCGSHGREPHTPGRNRESRPTKPPADVITVIPRREQHLPEENKHDAMLDSYDQCRFGGIIPDEWLPLEERISDLSSDLPAMLLPNGSYPRLPLAKRSFPDLMDGVGSSSEDDRTPIDVVARANLFVAWRNRWLHNPGRLPLWLRTYQPEGLPRAPDERDNSFRGMYGPGFTYDPCTNIMYTDCEAIDVARALTNGVEFRIPANVARRPNP